ncbi:YHYH protein [Oricola thermophila]|uniref:YHYH protein n=2 Tax=Oricola thermophila TaxID=2742145 RepID=A0A6N1VI42_9HYPH|nr:YHYH protein [Oricola thermophila]
MTRPFVATIPFLLVLNAAQPAHAHDDHCAAIRESVEKAGFADSVTVVCDGDHASIISDTFPDHEMMTGIVGTNEQVPVPAKDHAAPIPLEPKLGDTPQTRDSSLGVAVNGVPIYDYTAGGEMTEAELYHYQAHHDTVATQQLDECGGHAGKGDDYHYHAKPTCMIEQMKNAGDDAIIGWAFDGFPIFGDNNPDGTQIADGELDVCNGKADDTFGYRYHTSADAPYIIQCLMGEVADLQALPRVAPLRSIDGNGGRDSGVPPRGGVEDLVFTQFPGGGGHMEYSYRGETYYIRYAPSDRPDCYDFETRTVTNGGEVETGTYCR